MPASAPRALLADLFHTAVAAADPMRIVREYLPEVPRGRTVVVGAGKASARMALAFEQAWPAPVSGVVVTSYGHAEPCAHIRVLEAGHPVPDEAGLVGAQALLDAVSGLTEQDLVVALISGGGSALLPAPPPGVTLADEQALNRQLLDSGLPISAMNLLRRQVSRIKDGRLAQAAGEARVVSLIISDVPGDDPAQVASGPTVAGIGSAGEALALVQSVGLDLAPAILAHLRDEADAAQRRSRPDDAVHVIASAALSLEAAARHCHEHYGIACEVLGDAIEGEACEVGARHAEMARMRQFSLADGDGPLVLLSGGETTVTVASASRGGRGGRNTEFALAFAQGVQGAHGINALAADTDGIDGASGGAGAFVDGGSISRLREAGIDPQTALADHGSGAVFAMTDDLFVTGPTRTNVNDFRALYLEPLMSRSTKGEPDPASSA